MLKKNNLYSLDGLLIKRKNLQIIKAINLLRIFSSLHFFKVDYYPFDYKKYIIFYNQLVRNCIYFNFFNSYKSIVVYFLNVLNKNKILRNKFGFEIEYMLDGYSKTLLKLLKGLNLKKYKSFVNAKFKFKKLRKVRYLEKHKSVKKKKKTKQQVLKENIKMKFFSDLAKRIQNLKVIHHYIRFRYTKSLKRKFRYLRKKNKNTYGFLLKRRSDDLIYKRIRKKKSRKVIFTKFRINFKGKFAEKKEAAADLFKKISKNKRKVQWLLRRRKKKFLRKYFLIKKYKRIVFRRKKRTGILHFRMYYSNYYITLTDLSSNVIFSCSAGSVSDTNNKKTKMSNVVAMPIFYRILFFLRAFKIRNLKFVIRNRMDKIFYNALTFFKKRGYKIKSFSFVQKAPHHLGQRKQKPRRI